MPFDWTDDLARVDWDELSALYRVAPLGDKAPADLALVFGNSMFRSFAFDAGVLVGAGRGLGDGRDCAYLCDIAVLPAFIRHGGWARRSRRGSCALLLGTGRSFYMRRPARKGFTTASAFVA